MVDAWLVSAFVSQDLLVNGVTGTLMSAAEKQVSKSCANSAVSTPQGGMSANVSQAMSSSQMDFHVAELTMGTNAPVDV